MLINLYGDRSGKNNDLLNYSLTFVLGKSCLWLPYYSIISGTTNTPGCLLFDNEYDRRREFGSCRT